MIQFKIAAKTDVGRVRDNNEDNFQAADDLSVDQMRWVNDQLCSLGSRGALLVVADGMGGTNAGEVASEIAINTIRDWFTPQHITDEVVKNRYSIERFMKDAVVDADARIKMMAKENPASRNMGTTIVIGWIFDGVLYVTWCGDSRAYIYNSIYGLRQISKDHSYVQELVDQEKISQEDAFDFPDSNIITRCLSDSTSKARPECLVMPHTLCNGDIILLCSDGLNGMLRDTEIEQIISANNDNMSVLADTLIQYASNAGGHDNITVALCQIVAGGIAPSLSNAPRSTIGKGGNSDSSKTPNFIEQKKSNNTLYIVLAVLVGLLLLGSAAGFGYYYGANNKQEPPKSQEEQERSKEDPEIIPSKTQPKDVSEEESKNRESDDRDILSVDKPKSDAAVNKKDESPKSRAFDKLQGVMKPHEGDQNDKDELTPVPQKVPKDESVETNGENGTDPTLSETEEDKISENSDPSENGVNVESIVVQRNESAWSLAEKYNISLEELKKYNPKVNFDKLKAGQEIRIPKKQ